MFHIFDPILHFLLFCDDYKELCGANLEFSFAGGARNLLGPMNVVVTKNDYGPCCILSGVIEMPGAPHCLLKSLFSCFGYI